MLDPRQTERKLLPPRGKTDILDKLRNSLPDLHSAEQRVATVVLTDPNWVIENSIKSLATRAEVSEPTVMRLCRKLDCAGFSAFKVRLAEDLVIAKLYLEAERVIETTTPTTVTDTLLTSVLLSLREAATLINSTSLERAAEILTAAKMIYCFGVGGSSAVFAAEAENRIFRLGKPVQSSCDPYRQRMVASVVGAGDVILCISVTGRPKSLVDSSTLAISNGAEVISITDLESPLADSSNVVLSVSMFDDESYFNLPSRTRYAQLFVLDCLVSTVAVQIPHVADNLKTIRKTLSALHGVTKFQPIGD